MTVSQDLPTFFLILLFLFCPPGSHLPSCPFILSSSYLLAKATPLISYLCRPRSGLTFSTSPDSFPPLSDLHSVVFQMPNLIEAPRSGSLFLWASVRLRPLCMGLVLAATSQSFPIWNFKLSVGVLCREEGGRS